MSQWITCTDELDQSGHPGEAVPGEAVLGALVYCQVYYKYCTRR